MTVLSEAAGGRTLPTLAVVRGYVAACGGEPADWEQRWRAVADEQRAAAADRVTAAANGNRAGLKAHAGFNAHRAFLDASDAAEVPVSAAAVSATAVGAARRLRGVAAAAIVVTVAASVAVAVVISQRDTAAGAKSDAAAGQLAAKSAQLASVNPDAAALAALAAWHAEPTVEARSALLSTAICCSSTQTKLGASVTGLAVTGNPAVITSVSKDGMFVATAGNGGIITVWDAANLHRLATQPGSIGSVRALAFSPDDRTLASGGDYGTILLWDTANLSATTRGLAETASLSEGATVNALAFAPTGSTLISGDSAKRIVTWDLNPANVVRADCQTLAHAPGLAGAEALVRNASFPQLCPHSS